MLTQGVVKMRKIKMDCFDFKRFVIAGRIIDSLHLLVIASPCVSKAKQSKSHKSKRQGESMIDKRSNKLSQPKQTTDSLLKHCDSYSLDSREVDCFVVFASLKLPRNDNDGNHSP